MTPEDEAADSCRMVEVDGEPARIRGGGPANEKVEKALISVIRAARKSMELEPISRRKYLVLKAMESGAGIWLAREAVASVAIEHPEWDMDEVRTYAEWEAGGS